MTWFLLFSVSSSLFEANFRFSNSFLDEFYLFSAFWSKFCFFQRIFEVNLIFPVLSEAFSTFFSAFRGEFHLFSVCLSTFCPFSEHFGVNFIFQALFEVNFVFSNGFWGKYNLPNTFLVDFKIFQCILWQILPFQHFLKRILSFSVHFEVNFIIPAHSKTNLTLYDVFPALLKVNFGFLTVLSPI